MMTEPRTWIAAVRSSYDRLASLTDPLSAEKLASGSYCSEWSIAQVLSHLGSGAEIFGLFLDAGLSGGEPPAREAFKPIWDRWNARSPQEQAAAWRRSDAALVERLESLDDQQLASLHMPMFGMEIDAAGLARLRLSEHSVHSWDVAVALDPAAQLAPDAVDLLAGTLSQLAGRLGKPQGERLRLRVRTTGPRRELFLTVDGEVRLTESAGEEADGELRLGCEAFIRLMYGRLDPRHTPAGVEAEGFSLDSVRAVFPGF
jgi:uncharacterized protein (TIGR03083 family)